MYTRTTATIAALVAAIAFVIAFISTDVALLSATFALVGSVAMGLAIYVFARRILSHRLARGDTAA